MREISFTVPGKIKAKERPRRGRGGAFYTPRATQESENTVGWYGRLAMQKASLRPFNGPCVLFSCISAKIPDSWKESKKLQALKGEIFPCKGDLSNEIKSIEDGLNGVVWEDDKQVVGHRTMHVYGAVEVTIVRVIEIGNIKELSDVLTNRMA